MARFNEFCDRDVKKLDWPPIPPPDALLGVPTSVDDDQPFDPPEVPPPA
jgi:hypothetical protein